MLHDPKRDSRSEEAAGRAPWALPLRRLQEAWARAGWAQRLAREPIVHFILGGAVILAIGHGYAARTNVYRIEVTPQHVAELSRRYALQFGGPPDRRVLEQIEQEDLHDEMLYRHGKALGLDRDDEIVRRRIVQKTQFLLNDTRAPAEPTDAELADWYAKHADRYVTPERASFTHVFFADGPAGEARAKAALARLPVNATRDPDAGDPFPDLYDFDHYDAGQATRLFGHTPLAAAVFSVPVGRWSGPYRSAYGWHLVRVSERTAPRRPPLSEVRDRVRADYLQAAQDGANKAAFDRLASRFTIVRKDKAGGR